MLECQILCLFRFRWRKVTLFLVSEFSLVCFIIIANEPVFSFSLIDSSSTANSESDSDSENIYYSTYYEAQRKQATCIQKQENYMDRSSQCTFKLNINQSMLTMYSPVRVSIEVKKKNKQTILKTILLLM